MRVLFALIINLILTLLVEFFLMLDCNLPFKNYFKEFKKDIKYLIFVYMTFNFGYLIQNIFNIR